MSGTTLAQDRFGHPIQAVPWGPAQNVSFTSLASVQSAILPSTARVVRLCSDAPAWVEIADNPVAGAVTGVRLPADHVEYVPLPTNSSALATPRIAVRGIVGNGTLNIVACDR